MSLQLGTMRMSTMACRPTAALRPALRCTVARPASLQTAFLKPACSLHSLCSSFTGLRLSPGLSPAAPAPSRRGALVITNGYNSIGNTKGGTRRARTRTSGYRTRRLTPGGRHVLRNRRKRGRKELAPGCYRK